jgi:hypothetical protein
MSLNLRLDDMVDEMVVKVFSTKVGVTKGSLNLENTLLDCQKGDIEKKSKKEKHHLS